MKAMLDLVIKLGKHSVGDVHWILRHKIYPHSLGTDQLYHLLYLLQKLL